MSKYKKAQPASTETIDAALKIAKSTQRPNQTKEQTKLIAKGIEKGIAEYKKQQKAKAHELDKLKKKTTQERKTKTPIEPMMSEEKACKTQWLPWGLLLISWVAMILFVVSTSFPK